MASKCGFSNFASMRYEVNEANKRAVAEAIAEIGPTSPFCSGRTTAIPTMKWPRSLRRRLCGTAIACCPPAPIFKAPQRIYQYDNGPRHTIGFEPDTFVDISDEWRQASEWLGRLMAIVRNEKYDPAKPDAVAASQRNAGRVSRRDLRRSLCRSFSRGQRLRSRDLLGDC